MATFNIHRRIYHGHIIIQRYKIRVNHNNNYFMSSVHSFQSKDFQMNVQLQFK